MRYITLPFLALLLTLSTSGPASAVNECIVDGGGENPNITCGNASNGLDPDCCGHTVSGTNCNLTVDTVQTGEDGEDCLTLGKGVTVTFNTGGSFECPENADCGTAIDITDAASGAANKVTVTGGTARGFIDGCWAIGIDGNSKDFTTVNDVGIDLRGMGSDTCRGGVGIQVVDTVTNSVVSSADDFGAILGDNDEATAVIVKESDVGIKVGGTSDSKRPHLDGVVIVESGKAIQRATVSGKTAKCTGSCVIRGYTDCVCATNTGACTGLPITQCVDYGTAGHSIDVDTGAGVDSDIIED